jgi:putative ABC transport system substrate-binding protein
VIDRRTFLVVCARTVTIGLFTVPITGQAQQTRTVRIGWLALEPLPELLDAFKQGLQNLGYVERRNLVIDERYAHGRAERLADLAVELTRLNVDVMVSMGSAASLAAQRATTTLPIVFVVGDPVRTGLAASLAHPGGNATGLAIIAGELNGKRVELLKEAVPSVRRLAVLGDANAPSTSTASALATIDAAARGREIQAIRLPDVHTAPDLEAAFAAAVRARADGILVLSSPLLGAWRHQIVALATKTRLASIYEGRRFVEAGGLMSYGPNITEVVRRASVYVDRILHGAKPADLPVEQPTKVELVVNLKAAKTLGMTIPQSLLLRADEVIQ